MAVVVAEHLYKVLLCCCIVGDPENILNFLEASF